MKKILIVIILVVLLGWAFFYIKAKVFNHINVFEPAGGIDRVQGEKISKTPILRFALVADSENDNDLLAKALDQAKGVGVNFVIGLGDWSTVGTAGELAAARQVFEKSDLNYYMTAGDHDLWDSRNRGEEALTNYKQVFGEPTHEFDSNGVQFVVVDNSDIYKGISTDDWQLLTGVLNKQVKLRFVFAHKTPFHPQSSHIMGEDNPEVADQAQSFLALLEKGKVDGFFSGDLHFFAQFSSRGRSASGGKSPKGVRITTIGAVDAERNSQGPRFSTVTVYSDYSWEVNDIEIR